MKIPKTFIDCMRVGSSEPVLGLNLTCSATLLEYLLPKNNGGTEWNGQNEGGGSPCIYLCSHYFTTWT